MKDEIDFWINNKKEVKFRCVRMCCLAHQIQQRGCYTYPDPDTVHSLATTVFIPGAQD